MIQETIQRIEETLASANLSEEKRSELQALLASLKSELESLSAKDEEKARSVAGFAEVTYHEATRSQTDPDLLDLSVQGLSRSVNDMENDHPGLFKVVNTVCMMLSNSGI